MLYRFLFLFLSLYLSLWNSSLLVRILFNDKRKNEKTIILYCNCSYMLCL